MFQRLFPPTNDFNYRGGRLALWLLGAVLLLKIAISLGSIFNTVQAATEADGIPLSDFSVVAQQWVIQMFRLLGVSSFVVTLVGIAVVARYRALVPAYTLLLIADYVARKMVTLQSLPALALPTSVSPGLVINLVMFAIMVVALTLSLRAGK
jgi:hypothetical protein